MHNGLRLELAQQASHQFAVPNVPQHVSMSWAPHHRRQRIQITGIREPVEVDYVDFLILRNPLSNQTAANKTSPTSNENCVLKRRHRRISKGKLNGHFNGRAERKMLRNDENYIQNDLMHCRRFALIDASMVGRYFPDDERMCAVPS